MAATEHALIVPSIVPVAPPYTGPISVVFSRADSPIPLQAGTLGSALPRPDDAAGISRGQGV